MKVAVAIIIDPEERILITQRPMSAPHGGMWEFPGGKLEMNESAVDALIREVKEEVGLDIIQYEFLTQIDYDYQEKFVSLLVYTVHHFQGTATCLESQDDLRWVKKDELEQFRFPEANAVILNIIARKSQAQY
ncbi:MAG: 8-oxo-dGTP diphosphatase MutT [Legionellaceae bacterium]|nr:8-oxo-dGTP diphosphatase MutT [Legionellaceae bacterium]